MPASATRRAVPDLLRAGLLATKIDPPHPRQRVVPRERLMARLARGSSGRLTVVSAPAGWGKTTAVLEWRRRGTQNRSFAWLTLDADDSDPVRFWTGLAYAVDRALPGRVDEAVRLVGTGAQVVEQRVLPTQPSLREIADELYVSRNTVKTHSRALYRKLAIGTRDDAVEAARGKGLLTP